MACCGPWGHKEVDTTEQLNSKNFPGIFRIHMNKASVAKILTVCAPMLKRNTETEFWKDKKNDFIFAQQRGIHSRLAPQKLCPFSLRNRDFYIILKILYFFFFLLQSFKMATAGFRQLSNQDWCH